MKNTLMAVGAVLLAGSLSPPLPAATVRSPGMAKALTTDYFSELTGAVTQIQKSRAAIDKSRVKLEEDVLGQSGRNTLMGIIVKNEGIAAAYRGEALDEAQFLRAHQGALTAAQKDAVAQAWIDLGEGL